MKKLLKVLGWIVGLFILAFVCWVLVLYLDWSMWWVPLLMLGVLVVGFGSLWSVRRWRAWQVQRKLKALNDGGPFRTPHLDKQWKNGLQLLKRSRLRRVGGAFYALPWIMTLGERGSGKSTLLLRTRLSSPILPISQNEVLAPTDTLSWWFFDRSVVIDLAGRLLEPEGEYTVSREWMRLMRLMRRTRRREPLNGILLTLSIPNLLQYSTEQCADLGRRARIHVDALQQACDARIPVYLILTQSDALPGMVDWGRALPESLRYQPFGYVTTHPEAGAANFLGAAFAAMLARMADIRVQQGMRGLPTSAALLLPECVAQLQAPLAQYLIPAFEVTPYTDTPLLYGLFLTAEVPSSEKNSPPEGWFSQQLFDLVLPSGRTLYQARDRLGQWRRFLSHGGALLWIAFCIVLMGGVTYNYMEDAHIISQLSDQKTRSFVSTGGVGAQLTALQSYRVEIEELDRFNTHWWPHLQPFHRHLTTIETTYKANFCNIFLQDVLRTEIGHMLVERVPQVARGSNNALVAAYAQHLVRRINLLNAVLNNKPLTGLPLPGPELVPMLDDYKPSQLENPQAVTAFGTLYVSYLQWQSDRDQLKAELASLQSMLNQLALPERSLAWLTTWADMQGALPPVLLSTFWSGLNAPNGPRVDGAYTAEGAVAIDQFFTQLMSATQGSDALWSTQQQQKNTAQLQQQHTDFDTRYRDAQYEAWFRFVVGFNSATRYLSDQASWNTMLPLMATEKGPYFTLLQRLSTTFAKGPDNPPWILLAIRLDSLLQAARDREQSSSTTSSAMSFAKLANAIGGNVVSRLSTNDSLKKGVSEAQSDLSLADLLGSYQKTLNDTETEMLKGSGHTFKLASDTYAFNVDPSVKESTLLDAWDTLQKMHKGIITGAEDAQQQAVWYLLQGPLTFIFDYAQYSAACTLQQDWESQVLSSLQGVTDRDEASKQTTFLERGFALCPPEGGTPSGPS